MIPNCKETLPVLPKEASTLKRPGPRSRAPALPGLWGTLGLGEHVCMDKALLALTPWRAKVMSAKPEWAQWPRPPDPTGATSGSSWGGGHSAILITSLWRRACPSPAKGSP